MLSYSEYINGVILTRINSDCICDFILSGFIPNSFLCNWRSFFLRNTQFQLLIRMKNMFNDDHFLEAVTELKHPVDVDIISKYDVIFNILNMVIRNSMKQI